MLCSVTLIHDLHALEFFTYPTLPSSIAFVAQDACRGDEIPFAMFDPHEFFIVVHIHMHWNGHIPSFIPNETNDCSSNHVSITTRANDLPFHSIQMLVASYSITSLFSELFRKLGGHFGCVCVRHYLETIWGSFGIYFRRNCTVKLFKQKTQQNI